MSCLAEERFIEILDGGGLDATRPEERIHLDSCEACRESWSMASAAAAVIGDARPRRSARFGWFPLSAAAAVLLGIIGVVVFKSAPATSTKAAVAEPVRSFLDGTPEESRRARADLVKAGRPLLQTLVEARIRNKGSARLGAIRDLIHEIKGAGRAEFSGLEDRKYTIKIRQLTLVNTVTLVRANADFNLALDPGLSKDVLNSPVDLDVENGTLREILELLCTVTDLDFDFRYGVWFIGSPARLWSTKAGEPVALENSWVGGMPEKLRTTRITVDLQNASLEALLHYLNEVSGSKFAESPGMPEVMISIGVHDLPLVHLLELLTIPRGWDVRLEGETVVVAVRSK